MDLSNIVTSNHQDYIQKIIEYTEDESVPITLKRYYRLEQIFEKTNVYTEDIKDLSWEDIKGKYKDL